VGAIAGALIGILLTLPDGRIAQARSIVNDAPAAAERSGTLRFRSTLTITLDGRSRVGITEQGAIDFATGAYSSTLRFGNAAEVLERRGVRGVLYSVERPISGAPRARIRWFSTSLLAGTRVLFSESDALTDPRAVFRALSGIRAPVRRVGHSELGGVATTRYRLVSDLGAFLRPSAGHIENPAAYRRIRALLDVWLDGRGRPVQVQEAFTGGSASDPTTVRTIVSFNGYERPVVVAAPSDSVPTSTKGAAPPGLLATGLGALLARRLFFRAVVPSAPPP
jgi:hypothetical protein